MSGFNGSRVLSFESRRAQEIAQLIRNNGGVPVVAPSTREIETPSDEERLILLEILAGKFDSIIFMTGVGARALVQAAEAIRPRAEVVAALSRAKIIVRGPKPAAVARDLGVPIALTIPEPNTWKEIVTALDENPDRIQLKGARIAVQEHGAPSPELYAALRERGVEVIPIRVYRWELPENLEPLKHAVRELADKKIAVVLFTSSIQFAHAFRIAQQIDLGTEFLAGLENALVASIGPISSATLRENGVRVDLEPSHPKMGFLVKETAERTSQMLERER